MRVRLLTTAPHAGGVSRHVAELAAGLRGLGCDVGTHPGQADIVHIHLHDTYDRRAFALALGARSRGARVILTEHLPRTNASDPSLLPGPRRRGALLAKGAFKRAEATLARKIVTVCEGSRYFLQERYGIGGSQVRTILNGVVPHRDSGGPTPNGQLRVVAIGTLNVQKGHDVLIAAAARSRGQWRATIIGSGSARTALDQLAGELQTPRVSLAGWRDDASDASLEADVLCLPSRWEACPYVVLDAMARSRCVVATSVDGLPEIVEHGVSGMLVPPDDASELARVLDWLGGHPDEVRRMGLAARERVEKHFDLERMIMATHDLYREALDA
jgi:glycosyltransferase involved in cell wall biosynthesis